MNKNKLVIIALTLALFCILGCGSMVACSGGEGGGSESLSTDASNIIRPAPSGLLVGGGSESSSADTSPPPPADPGQGGLHSFTGLPITEAGWTDFQWMFDHPAQYNYSGSRIVYVSNAGNDSTGTPHTLNEVGGTPFNPTGIIKPYKTLTAAYAQMRNGYPDIMLLNRGDTWNEYFHSTSIGNWTKSGPSASTRTILGAYGTGARPILNHKDNDGFNGSAINLIVTSIEFRSVVGEMDESLRGDAVGVGFNTADQLYEDCYLNWTAQIIVQGPDGIPASYPQRIAFRRNILDETRTFYAVRTTDLLIEENIFYKPEQKGRHLYMSPAGLPDNHTVTGLTVKGNIFFECNNGIDMRGGGGFSNNLVVRNDSITFGGTGGSKDSIQSGDVSNNIFLEANGISTEYSLQVINNDGTNIQGNIWTDPTGLAASSMAIRLKGLDLVHVAKNINIHQNIVYGWAGGATSGRPLYIDSTLNDVLNVSIHDNDFQMATGSSNIVTHLPSFSGFRYADNRYYSTIAESGWFRAGGSNVNLAAWVAASGETGALAGIVTYTDPSRTLKTYNQTLGGTASTDEFMLSAIQQSRANWNPNYTACAANNYIRAGFDKTNVACGF